MPLDPQSHNQLTNATRMLKARMMENGLHHLGGQFGSRTAFLLEDNEIVKNTRQAPAQIDVTPIVDDPKHPRRRSAKWGPLVFFADDDNRKGVVSAVELLIDPDTQRRRAALRQVERGMAKLTPRTRDVIRKNRECVRRSKKKQWLRPAVSIHDAINTDLFFNLAGLRQSVTPFYEDGFNHYWRRVIRPSLLSVDSIPPSRWNQVQVGKMEEFIDECVTRASTLREAVDVYYKKCGHLPLAAQFSFPRIVNEWLEHSKTSEDVWSQIWNWAREKPDPIRRYHACSVFLNEPQFVPEHAAGELWLEVAKVVTPSDDESEDTSADAAWYLWCDLATHYCQYIECLSPGQEGEVVAAIASWLATQVANTLLDGDIDIQRFREQAVRPFSGTSSNVRRLVHPSTGGAAFRYATLFLPSIWSLSLLCQVGRNITSLSASEIEESSREIITKSMSQSLLAGAPDRRNDSSTMYAFDHGLASSAHKWMTATLATTDQGGFEALIQMKTRGTNLEELLDVVGDPADLPETVQFLSANFLGGAVYSGTLPLDSLWSKLQDQQWREATLLQCSLETTVTLCDLLIEAAVTASDEWKTQLPHILATACEASLDDRERQRLLFAYVVLSSVATDTISALRRLLHSHHKHALHTHIMTWKDSLASLIEAAEPWIAARIRPTLGELSANV